MSLTPTPRADPDDSDEEAPADLDDSAEVPGGRRDWWGAFASGLFHTGFLAALAVSAWEGFALFWVVLVVYVVLLAVLLTSGSDDTARRRHAKYAGAGLTVTLVIILIVPLDVALRLAGREGLQASLMSVFWVGGSLGLASGAWIMGFRQPTGSGPARSLPVLGRTAGAATLIPAVLVAMALPIDDTFAQRTTADPGPASAPPADPREEIWEWAPDRRAVREVFTGSHGPVVVVADGLVGLDGTDGRELWSVRFPGQETGRSGTFDEGRSVYHIRSSSHGEQRLWVLDASTGESRVDDAPYAAQDITIEGGTERFLLTSERPDDLLLSTLSPYADLAPGEPTRVAVTDTRTGEELWAREAEEIDGTLCHYGEDPVFRDDLLFVARMCAAPGVFDREGPQGRVQVGFAALDPLSGETRQEVLWDHEERDASLLIRSFRVGGTRTVDEDTLLVMEDDRDFLHLADVDAGRGRSAHGDFPETTENALADVDREELVYEGRRPLGISGEPGSDVVLTRIPLDGEPSVATTLPAPAAHQEAETEGHHHALLSGRTGLVLWAPPQGREGPWELHSVSLTDTEPRPTRLLGGTGIVQGTVMAPGAVALALSDRVIGIG
ncbi:PQQ-binding-like beta-propeller repeat protein [Nocardiopsis sp. MG754419]|uniref:outer membrane protein assembly factor BamB family protein n=1 Tax=Nocardiopsis sp. MG754419 TaxID=2259865 RepID=UPI001BA85E32|nr:PQQ-binding-like beta-propeller repeat protein [Nocardiopsis sp. MG754419]MBR8740613.1 hypothetical protein [Nocardiopsis sp. MG754419]